jgi:hypothetical protein
MAISDGAGNEAAIAAILADHSPAVRELCEELRALIRAAVPDAIETAHPGWHGIGYHHPDSGYFAAIFPHVKEVKVGFEWGALLPDPDGLLVGSGKQLRYLPLAIGQTVPADALRRYLGEAVGLPPSREAKLDLIRNAARPGAA